MVVGLDYVPSDPISCSPNGPGIVIDGPKLGRKKLINEIYENIKIPFSPSYFPHLIHSSKKLSDPSIPFGPPTNLVVLSSEMEDSCSRYSGGSILCCESINDSDVNQGDSRFKISVEVIHAKVWQTIKELGIEGEEDDELFEGIVRDMEDRDRKAFEESREVAIRIP